METVNSRINASSRRQAMDWSLVLLSQGLESVIDQAPEGGEWSLLVAPEQELAATEAIQLYEAENHRRPWRRPLTTSGPFVDWSSLVWALLTCGFYWLTTVRDDLRLHGAMDNAAVSAGEWWRLFTAIWLHGDVGHLAANVTVGVILLGLVMWRYGTGVGLLAASLTGVGGNLLAWLVWPASHRSLGASGMVMGSLGLLAVQSVVLYARQPQVGRHGLVGVLAGVLLFVLFGVAPETDVLAHLGGFLSGLALGTLISGVSGLARNGPANFISGGLFTLLVVWPWAMAIRRVC